MRVLTLLARHGTRDYADAPDRVAELFRRRAPGVEHVMLIVDNALPAGCVEPLDGNRTVIGGDNAWHEFSAWDQALRHCRDGLGRFDALHLATSAFDMLYNAYLERFDERTVRLVRDRPVAAGHIDYYPHPVVSGTCVSQHWLRTSFVFLPPHEALRLGSFVSFTDRDALFSGDPARPFRADAPVSPGYRALILDWLTTSRGTGQGTSWHSCFDLTWETLPRFENKALAILNEHALSARLRALGCAPIDLTYLSDPDALRRAEQGDVPSWRRQVASRGGESHPYPAAVRWV